MKQVVVIALLAMGCGARSGPSGGEDDAILVIRCDVADATLWLDGRYIREVGEIKGGVYVTPGRHRVEIRHDDHFSHYQELDLASRERRVLDVDLAPVLP
jgi:hypothetical protein